MPEFKLPQTAAEWNRVQCEQINTSDLAIEMECRDQLRPPRVAAAVARLLERERCVAALAAWFGTQGGFGDDEEATDRDFAEARRILEGTDA